MATDIGDDVVDTSLTEEADSFDFDAWAVKCGLTRKSVLTLKKEELTTMKAITLLEVRDVKELGFTMGQYKLIMAAICDLQKPTAVDEDLMPVSAVSHVNDDMTIKDIRAQTIGLNDAGKRLDELLSGNAPPTVVNVPIHAHETSTSTVDPRTILTMKSQSHKAVHVTQFLTEKAKRRRQSRRKDFVMKTSGPDSERLLIKCEDDHPYGGIFIEEWGAANCRVMNHLLQTGQLSRPDMEYYLAYTAKVFEFAEKYEWHSVLDFDFHYREMQAEHQFKWGTFAPHMELHLLTPKRRQTVQGQWSGQGPAPERKEDCKIFKAKGTCPFGTSCKYRHPRQSSDGVTKENASKNQ